MHNRGLTNRVIRFGNSIGVDSENGQALCQAIRNTQTHPGLPGDRYFFIDERRVDPIFETRHGRMDWFSDRLGCAASVEPGGGGRWWRA